MSSSSNKNKKAVSFSLKTSPQAKSKPAVKPQAPVVNKIQPKPSQNSSAKPNKGASIKNIQPVKAHEQPKHQPAKPVNHPQVKSAAQSKPQPQQLKNQPKVNAGQKPQMQHKNQPGQKIQQQNQVQPKQQFQPKPPVSAQPKSQPQQKIKNAQSFTKQQPLNVKPAVELRKAAMTSDKDKVKVQAPAKQQPVHNATQSQHAHPSPAANTADFSAETLALLFKNAKKASENAYVPYSRFKVGAVLILEDTASDAGQISAYTGCNVENASYGLTCCAERIAIFKAVSDGNKKFKAMIIYASAKKPVSPCGACRQVIAEFAAPDMKVYSIGQFKDEEVSKTPYAVYTVAELLPHGFKASDFIEKK